MLFLYQICKGKITFSVGKDGSVHEIYNVGKIKKTPSLADAKKGVGTVSPSQGGADQTVTQSETADNSKSGQIFLSDTAAKAYRALTNSEVTFSVGEDGIVKEVYNISKFKKTPFLTDAKTGWGAISPSQEGVADTLSQSVTADNGKSGQIFLSDTAAKAYRALTNSEVTFSVGEDGFAYEIHNVGKMETAPFPKANHSSVKSAQPEVDNRTYPQKTQHGSTADRNDAAGTLPQQNSVDNSKSGQIPLSDTAAKAYRALTNSEVTFSVGKDGIAHEIYNIGKMKKAPSLANAMNGVGAVSPSQGGTDQTVTQSETTDNSKSGQISLSDTAAKAYRALTNIAASMPEGSNAKAAASDITAQAPSLSGLGAIAEALYTDEQLRAQEKSLVVDSFAQGIADHLQSLGDEDTSRSAGYAIAETLLNPAAKLTAEQRDALLASPHALQVMESVAREMEATRNATASKKESKTKTGGRVDTSAIAGETLDENQKAAVDVIKLIAQATGVNFSVFASQVDEQGRYVGENGSYDPATHTVRIDIHAGKNSVKDLSQYALLRTVSHELTHFIQQEGGEAYQQLKDFFAAEFEKRGTSMAELVQNKLEENAAAVTRLKEQGYTDEQLAGRQMDEKQAEAEVIADASEMMLKDSQAIARLAAQNESIFFRLKSFLLKLFARMNKAFEKVSAASKEARLLKQYTADLQAAWDHALETAAKGFNEQRVVATNTQTTQVNSNEKIQYSPRNNHTELAQTDHLQEDKYFQSVLQQWDETAQSKRIKVGLVPERSIYVKVGLQAGSLYMDYSKLETELKKHADHLTKEEVAQIPQLLSNPYVITEPINTQVKNTINVFGELFSKDGDPIMVGLRLTADGIGRQSVLKISTIHQRSDFAKLMQERKLLYVINDKKRIQRWGRRLGNSLVPSAVSSHAGFIRRLSPEFIEYNGESGQKEIFSDRVDLKYDLEDAMASLAEDVASGQHDSLLLSGDNKAELRAYGTDVAKLTSLQEKLQDQHEIMKDEHASKDEKTAARNRANMYQEQIAKLQERMQQVLQNPKLKAEAESRMETASRLLGKMTKAELQQEVVSLRERVNQLKRSYAARADSSTRQELRKAQAKLAFLESKHAQQLLDQKAEMQQRIKQEKTMNKQRIERDKLRSTIIKSVKKLNNLIVHETDYKHVPEALHAYSPSH